MRRLPLSVLAVSIIASVLPALGQTVIGTVPIGNTATYFVADSATDKIYINNDGDGGVAVIDGATNATANVHTGVSSGALAVNKVTNEASVANGGDNTATFINGTRAAGTTQLILDLSGYFAQ